MDIHLVCEWLYFVCVHVFSLWRARARVRSAPAHKSRRVCVCGVYTNLYFRIHTQCKLRYLKRTRLPFSTSPFDTGRIVFKTNLAFTHTHTQQLCVRLWLLALLLFSLHHSLCLSSCWQANARTLFALFQCNTFLFVNEMSLIFDTIKYYSRLALILINKMCTYKWVWPIKKDIFYAI